MPKARLRCNWQLIQGVAVSPVPPAAGEGNVFPSGEGKLIPDYPLRVPSQTQAEGNRGTPGRTKLDHGQTEGATVPGRTLPAVKSRANVGGTRRGAPSAKSPYRIPASDSTKCACGSRGSASNRAN